MKKIINILIALSILSLASSCKKEDEDDRITETTSLQMMFQHSFGMDNTFNLNTKYSTENGDTIIASKLAYFISNIKLTDINGNVLREPDSYHLVEEVNDEMMDMFMISDIPVGYYTKIEFSIGVDAVANSSEDEQVGDLLPSNNPSMVWSWAAGYKFLSLEGNYISDEDNEGSLVYHIGGDANYKTLSFELNNLALTTASENKAHFMVDVSEIFKNPTTVDLEDVNIIMNGASEDAQNIANNYANGMIMLHHAE